MTDTTGELTLEQKALRIYLARQDKAIKALGLEGLKMLDPDGDVMLDNDGVSKDYEMARLTVEELEELGPDRRTALDIEEDWQAHLRMEKREAWVPVHNNPLANAIGEAMSRLDRESFQYLVEYIAVKRFDSWETQEAIDTVFGDGIVVSKVEDADLDIAPDEDKKFSVAVDGSGNNESLMDALRRKKAERDAAE